MFVHRLLDCPNQGTSGQGKNRDIHKNYVKQKLLTLIMQLNISITYFLLNIMYVLMCTLL